MERQLIFDYPGNNSDIDQRFAAYLAGKTVAIVGRMNLHELEQGDFIDSHDVVVRIHSAIPYTPDITGKPAATAQTPREFEKFVGTRTDVFYHRFLSNVELFKESGQITPWIIDECEQFKRRGGSFMCYEDPDNMPLRFAIGCLPMEMRFLNGAIYAELARRLVKDLVEPGVVIISDILSHDIKSAYITGVPCYFDEMFDLSTERAQKWSKLRDINELRFLYELSNDDRVTCDSIMNSLFERYVIKGELPRQV